jgi:cell wall-associated NlpC family hydrolase
MTSPARVVLAVGTAAVVLVVCCAAFLVLIIAVLVGGVVGGGGCGGDGGLGGGSQRVGPRTWSGEQTTNAALITSTVIGRGLPRRAAVIAVATAIVESGLRNLTYGDRDSLGLFQQRPSQGWGAAATILNPSLATGKFLDHLLTIPGWATLAPGLAEQAVQRSANPGAYQPQETPAADLVAKYWSGPDNPLPPAAPAAGVPGARLASFGLAGCPDQGGSNLPLDPGATGSKAGPTTPPPGYQLPSDPPARAAVAYAIAQLGKPYVWGATGPNSFDCSGLVQASWAAAGVAISRSTASQVNDGTAVAGVDQVQPGDLLFIPGSTGTPTHPGHVGIAAGAGLVIDAYDSTHGVIAEKLTTWAPKLVAIRRVAPATAKAGTNPVALAEGAPTP